MTLALIKCDMANIFDEEKKWQQRDNLLREALGIVDRYRMAATDSLADRLQMDVVKMRILRKLDQPEKAIELGKFIVNSNIAAHHRFLHAESLLALAHAYLRDFDKNGKGDSLTLAAELVAKVQADKSTESNFRLRVLSTLHASRIANRKGEHKAAISLWSHWEQVEPWVQYDWIREFGKKVKKEIEPSKSVILTINSHTKVYDDLNGQLRNYLVDEYAKDAGTAEAADKIGVSRQTLYEWRKRRTTSSSATEAQQKARHRVGSAAESEKRTRPKLRRRLIKPKN